MMDCSFGIGIRSGGHEYIYIYKKPINSIYRPIHSMTGCDGRGFPHAVVGGGGGGQMRN